MKRTVLISTLAASLTLLALTPVAGASYFRQGPATRPEQASASRIARDYWRANAPAGLAREGLPLCGAPRISWASFPASDDHAAEAHVDGSCRIAFNSPDWAWALPSAARNLSSGADTWPAFCTAMAHEWGHLILGPSYFRAINPADPGHSPDPRNLMYASGVHELPACERTPDPAPSSARTSNETPKGHHERIHTPHA